MATGTPPKSTGAALVLGGGVAGIQCSLDLAEGGYKVYLVEKSPALGGHMAQLDKTFPTNDCSMCTLAPKLVEAARHLNIEIVTNAELTGLDGRAGQLHGQGPPPRPLRRPGEVHQLRRLRRRSARSRCPTSTTRDWASARPSTSSTRRRSPTPTRSTRRATPPARAPARSRPRAQGYVALIAEGRFAEAYTVASEPEPVPVGLRPRLRPPLRDGLHARLGRRAHLHRRASSASPATTARPAELPEKLPGHLEEKVAIVGGGPAGLSCARDLAQYGYATTVFEALPVAGGMLRVGIPDYRMPPDVLQQEIDRICALGVDLRLNQRCGTDFTVDGLLDDGYKAVFLAPGLHASAPRAGQGRRPGRLPARPSSSCATPTSASPMPVGDRVVVIGGGDVAFDAARPPRASPRPTARRPKVTIAYRRRREEMPASARRSRRALTRGQDRVPGHAPVEIIGDRRQGERHQVPALQARRARRAAAAAGPSLSRGDFFEIACDTVIFAIGQAIVDDFVEGLDGVGDRAQRRQGRRRHAGHRPRRACSPAATRRPRAR